MVVNREAPEVSKICVPRCGPQEAVPVGVHRWYPGLDPGKITGGIAKVSPHGFPRRGRTGVQRVSPVAVPNWEL
jgi:hypothetical protein